MRLILKDFQADAVDDLIEKLLRASREVRESNELQAVGVSSLTGSGKTVILTAAMEALIAGNPDREPLSDATFLWVTDQPQLNEQTRRKMLRESSILNESNLITIGNAFDREQFARGTVNFLNIQKLGKERDLITKGDERHYTIWDTISNTVTVIPDRFFVIVDEAHRGMTESPVARAEANTIIQKFIKGSPEEIPPVPLIIGVSATLDRFNNLVSGAGRTVRPIDIPVEDVRASGLIKDVVTLYHPTATQPTDITMLREAARALKRFTQAWKRYCEEESEPLIKPILVVQVEDATGKRISRTDLEEVLSSLEEELGTLPQSNIAHSFQEGVTLNVGSRSIRYLAPADIVGDRDVQIVLFKSSLNTGWDCPRAEVMMSFRTAIDATSIAQLVGRMVRNPLARRVESQDFLNTVSLYLPHYDAEGLDRVIERLTTPDPESMPPTLFRRGEDQVEVFRVSKQQEAFNAIGRLPSYVIPTKRKGSQIRRLMKLARALSNDEIDDRAEENALSMLLSTLMTEFDRISQTEIFRDLIANRRAEIRAVDWQVGLDITDETERITLNISDEDIGTFFDIASRRIGDEGLNKEWWKARKLAGVDSTVAKLELIALSIDPGVRKKLEDAAQKRVSEWLKKHNEAVSQLSESRRDVYEEVRARAKDPELRSPVVLPSTMLVRKSTQKMGTPSIR